MIPLPNMQPIEPKTYDRLGTLDVIRVWPTIQGEGPDAGTPAVFVRLAGCNLRCPACDTDYTTNRAKLGAGGLSKLVQDGAKANHIKLVVLTGGEPFRQNIEPLVGDLLNNGYQVQIETNGTLPPPTFGTNYWLLSIICSPKAARIHPDLTPHITAYKYVVEWGMTDPEDGLPTSVLGNNIRVARPAKAGAAIFVQPMDSGDELKDSQNLQTALDSVRNFGYRLSLQLHKHLGLD